MNLQYTLCLICLCASIVLSAQQEVPISQNNTLERFHANQELLLPKAYRYDPATTNLEKRACAVEEESTSYAFAGETIEIEVNIDPVDQDTLGAELQCDNCDETIYGTATLNSEGNIIYVANTGIEGARESVAVSLCNMIGCNTIEYPVVVVDLVQVIPYPL